MTAWLSGFFSMLRTDDRSLSEQAQSRIQYYRALCLLAVLLLPLFGFLYSPDGPEVVDPMWPRLVLAGGFGGLVMLSYVSPWVRRHFITLIQVGLYALMVWYAAIASLNEMAADYAVGLLLVFCVVGICIGLGIDTLRPLLYFLTCGILVVGLSCVFAAEPQTSPSILFASVVSVAAVLFVVIRAQLTMRRSLRRMSQAAREASRLKTALLSNVSHEIRTPLTSILGFAELIAENRAENPEQLASRIRESGRTLLDMLNAVLQVSQLESETVELTPKEVDVGAFVVDRVKAFEATARKKGVQLQWENATGSRHVDVDPDALAQVVDVLVRNAIEFSEDGDTASVRVATTEEHVRITVEDTGIGISDAFLDDLFGAFEQESIGRSRTHEGTGLGLTLAHRLVDLMGGSIAVESEKGEGTRVNVRLPLNTSVAQAQVEAGQND